MQTFYPENNNLAKHIAYYYFVKSDELSFCTDYFAFPNIYNGLSIYRSADFNVAGNSLTVHADYLNHPLTLVQSRYQSPLRVKLYGPVDMVTIVFKPLGVNHFMTSAYSKITRQVSQAFDEWRSDEYSHFIESFFAPNDPQNRLKLLESFLLTKLHAFNEDNVMEKAIAMISNLENEMAVGDIAETLNMSLRTLNRLFQKHVGVSPVTFRKVLRFRQSLKNKLFNDQFKRLTDIGYASNFYDPSYFNRVYKELTGSNPTDFFRRIDIQGDNAPLFQYLKNG